MRLRRAVGALSLMMAVLLPQFAFAQDGASVVVLKFENQNVEDAEMATFDKALLAGIEAHAGMHVKESGKVTVQDLALTGGCASPDATCLSNLRDFVQADRVVFGSVQRADDAHIFVIKMFDFAESRFVSETEQTLSGGGDGVSNGVDAVVEALLYGDVGSLEVAVEGADSPDLYFDGDKMGIAPATLDNLPLGEHEVTLRSSDGQEKSETVLLRYQQPASVSFEFEPVIAGPAGGGAAEAPSPIPGWVAVGVGVAGIAVGVVGHLGVVDAEQKRDRLLDEFLVETADGQQAFRSPEAAAQAEAENLTPVDEKVNNPGKSAALMRIIGFSAGAVGLLTGGFLLFRAYTFDGGGETETAGLPMFDFVPTADGFAATMTLRF